MNKRRGFILAFIIALILLVLGPVVCHAFEMVQVPIAFNVVPMYRIEGRVSLPQVHEVLRPIDFDEVLDSSRSVDASA